MKRIFLMTLLCLGLMAQGWAQPGRNRPSSEERLNRVTKMINDEMDLSDEQMAEVQEIYKEFFNSMEKERDAIQKAMQAKRTELIQKRNDSLEVTLSEKEYDELIALMESMRREMRGKMGKGRGPGR